ncbi:MAG: ABC transporter permease, partial [Lewinella sp.]|nr:ABC transporter permease [Lewinella sp.]
MIFHYLKVLLRTLWRNKTYTFLNLLGLTGGLAAFLFIMLYVRYEFSFDQYNTNKDRIYRVIKREMGDFYMGTDEFVVTPAPMAPTLMEEYPEVETATSIYKRFGILFTTDNQSFVESQVYGIRPETFDIFSLEVIAGKKEDLLKNRNSVVLSESYAQKYFGDTDPIGQTIRYRDEQPFTVVGVIKDMPPNTHFRMDMMLDFISMMETENRSLTNWQNSSFYTYLLLREGADPTGLAAKFPDLVKKYVSDNNEASSTRFMLQDFLDIHLTSKANFDIGPTGDRQKLYIYSLIAVLILIIACINYVNLSTAKAFRRAREVGIRKTVGAFKGHLIAQFLGESYLLSLGAMFLACTLVYVLLPSFSEFVGRELSFDPIKNSWLLPILALIFAATGLLSGAYPAFVLSSFKPVLSLKGTPLGGNRKSGLRNVLVVTQFAVSAALIISTLIISRQLNFIQNKDMGYRKEQIIVVDLADPQLQDKLPILRDEVARIPEVEKVSIASSMPNNISSNSGVQFPGKPDDLDIMFYSGYADYDYIDLFDLELAEGRSFSRDYGDESKSAIINQSAAKTLGWEEPLGKHLINWNGDTATVVGVLKDFHQHSLHLSIAPLQLFFNEREYEMAIRLSGEHINETITAIEATFKQFSEHYPFDYRFFDEVFASAYINDQKTATLANWFTVLIIIIACLGLYGLSAFTTEMRIKEVGIRKVLGASVSSIVLLLTRNYLTLILLSFLIAVPVSYWVMSRWLNNFAYHI